MTHEPPARDCVTDATWARFVHGDLDEEAASAVRAHLARCSACTERLVDAEEATSPETPAGEAPHRPTLARGASVGRYLVLDLLGAGAMGEVYTAFDPELERKVAVKVLRGGENGAPERRARLVREAQAMARLQHPNVVAVHDVGISDGQVFLTMEHLNGVTLRAWLQAAPRSWREILRTLRAAGRGLAAAHAASLVHRDFKPDNVLVSTSGEVKVTDFGIADAPAPDSSSSSLLRQSLLPSPLRDEGGRAGGAVILGTPGYMAPEQYEAKATDARSDQFSFCVTLYEALYGERPFEGAPYAVLRESVLAGRVREAPKGASVPLWVRRVLVRGLRVNPDERHPSMDALLQALTRDPGAALRRGLAMGAAAAALVAASYGVTRASAAREQALCSGAEPAMREVWNDGVRARIAEAFAASGKPYAPAVWAETSRVLDGFAAKWIAMHRGACEATRLRGEQSEAVLQLRMGCLDQRRKELRALASVLVQPEGDTVEKAAEAARRLPGVDVCADVEALLAKVPLPTSPEVRAEVEAVRAELAVAAAQVAAGQYTKAQTTVKPLVERAHATQYRPLEAEVLEIDGRVADGIGDSPRAIASLKQAVWAAEAGRSELIEVRAAIEMGGPLADLAQFEPGHDWLAFAGAALGHLGEADALEAERIDAEGWLFLLEGRHAEATERFRRAIALLEHARDPDPLRLVNVQMHLASSVSEQGQIDEALALYARGDATTKALLGEDHPNRIGIVGNQANLYVQSRRFEDAVTAAKTSLALAERSLLGTSPRIAIAENTLAFAYAGLHRYDDALATFAEAARVSREAYGEGHWMIGVIRSGGGDVLLEQHRFAEAKAAYASALAIEEPKLPADHPYVAEALCGLGRAELGLGHPKQAVAPLERALTIYAAHPIDSERSYLAHARFALARALALAAGASGASEGSAPRARALAALARGGYEELKLDAEQKEVDAWLATR